MPHAIDCMHLSRNVFESTARILLDMKTKTKDGLKSRQDLTKRKKWREKERVLAAAGLEDPFEGINERGRDFLNAR